MTVVRVDSVAGLKLFLGDRGYVAVNAIEFNNIRISTDGDNVVVERL